MNTNMQHYEDCRIFTKNFNGEIASLLVGSLIIHVDNTYDCLYWTNRFNMERTGIVTDTENTIYYLYQNIDKVQSILIRKAFVEELEGKERN